MKTSTIAFTHRAVSSLLFLALALPTSLSFAQNAEAHTYPSTVITRHAGADRYETAELASRASYPNPDVVDSLIVVSGDNFSDALAVAPLATALKAPVVSTATTSLSASVRRECQRLAPDTIYLIGGTSAVTAAVETELASYAKVERIGGTDRHQTAVLLADKLTKIKGTVVTEAFLASSAGFADALSIGAVAAHLGCPLLLSDPEGLDATTAGYLKDNNIKKVVVVGGTAAVPPRVEINLAIAGVTDIERISGTDRFGTADAVLSYVRTDKNNTFYNIAIASGSNYPDATVAAANLGAKGGLVLISEKDSLSSYIADFLSDHGSIYIATIKIYGGKAALSERLESTVYRLLGLQKTVTSNN